MENLDWLCSEGDRENLEGSDDDRGGYQIREREMMMKEETIVTDMRDTKMRKEPMDQVREDNQKR